MQAELEALLLEMGTLLENRGLGPVDLYLLGGCSLILYEGLGQHQPSAAVQDEVPSLGRRPDDLDARRGSAQDGRSRGHGGQLRRADVATPGLRAGGRAGDDGGGGDGGGGRAALGRQVGELRGGPPLRVPDPGHVDRVGAVHGSDGRPLVGLSLVGNRLRLIGRRLSRWWTIARPPLAPAPGGQPAPLVA